MTLSLSNAAARWPMRGWHHHQSRISYQGYAKHSCFGYSWVELSGNEVVFCLDEKAAIVP